MKNVPNNSLQYISMDIENLKKYSPTPVNSDYIFLFDIDDTLYKSTIEMESIEMDKWKKAYDNFKTETPSVPDFNTLLNACILYSESFNFFFNKSPYEVEKCKGFLEYSKYINKDEELKTYLENFPYRKWCFTNGMKCRAEPILKCLEIEDCFEGVICMDNGCPNGNILGKPYEEMYKFVEDLLQIKDKSKVYFFDDSVPNIETGKRMGWNSFLIKKEDYIINVLKNIVSDLSDDMER